MLKKIITVSLLSLSLTSITAFANGNGNDGCHILGYEDSHKNNGQSNEHKINIGYLDFEREMLERGVIAIRKSENIDSNGWITYHILDEYGNQIEVAKVRGQEEEVLPPVEDGSEDDNIMVEPPVGDGSEDDNFLIPDLPVGEGELPDIGVEPPIEDGSEEDDFLRPELPVEDGSEEDNNTVEPPIEDGSEDDDFLKPNIPVEDNDNSTPEPPIIEDEVVIERTDLPVTGFGATSTFAGLGSIVLGLILGRNKED